MSQVSLFQSMAEHNSYMKKVTPIQKINPETVPKRSPTPPPVKFHQLHPYPPNRHRDKRVDNITSVARGIQQTEQDY